jgi:ribonuclease D
LFWIGEAAALEAVCLKLHQEPFVGLDVETTLTTQRMCLMQLATPSATYLMDVLALHSLSPLAALLESLKTKKLIHNAPFETRVLAARGLSLAGVVDTLQLSRRLRGRHIFGGHSLSVVCARELGKPLDKTEQTSNWQKRPLSPSQIAYAALDAEVLLRLWEVFSGFACGESLR